MRLHDMDSLLGDGLDKEAFCSAGKGIRITELRIADRQRVTNGAARRSKGLSSRVEGRIPLAVRLANLVLVEEGVTDEGLTVF